MADNLPLDPKYPIVPRFADWEFPHDNLPPYWQNCVIPRGPSLPRAGSPIVDVSCRITAHCEGVQTAYFVPTSEAVWFTHNGMTIYTSEVGTVNNSRNMMLLRADLHSIFDARTFAIVPKTAQDQENPTFVVHVVLSDVSSEIVQLYHDVPLQPLTGLAIEFLFARFAWTVIPYANTFLGGGVPRALRVRDGTAYKTQTFSAPKCAELGKPSPSGSTTPKKRKGATETSAEEEESERELDLEKVDKRLERTWGT